MADAKDGARPRRLRTGLLLSAITLVAVFLVLECLIRLFVPRPAPILVRDHIYSNQLYLVNGRHNEGGRTGAPLPEKKRDHELRIMVFGESSVQGGPLGNTASPPTMLYDQLHAALPNQDLTVVNMGRGAAKTIDSYYYLVAVERFAPDIIIFYQGGNDVFHTDYESCMPLEHAAAHRAFRWLVEHSRLAWTVRAMGPAVYVGMTRKEPTNQNGQADRCDANQGFRAWTEVLVSTAQRMGARVLVTTPVENHLRHAEHDDVRRAVKEKLDLPGKSPAYRALLACLVTDGCDQGAAWKQPHPAEWDDASRMRARGDAWRQTAAQQGATLIDFFELLETTLAGGMTRPIFLEEVHLTLDGYWLLAWLWSKAVGPMIDAKSYVAASTPPPLDGRRYLSDFAGESDQSAQCILLHHADWHLRANLVLVAAIVARAAVAMDAPAPGELASSRAGIVSQLLIGWLRRELGMDPALPAALQPLLATLDIEQIARELRENGDCSSVGGPALEPLVGASPAHPNQGNH